MTAREKVVEASVRVELSLAHVMVMKNRIEACPHCRKSPPATTGLGVGSSDLICVVPPYGRFLAIEMKRPGYRPSDVTDDQRRFMEIVRKYNGVAGVACSEDEAFDLLSKARRLP
jgi:hypothetical protein